MGTFCQCRRYVIIIIFDSLNVIFITSSYQINLIIIVIPVIVHKIVDALHELTTHNVIIAHVTIIKQYLPLQGRIQIIGQGQPKSTCLVSHNICILM